MQNMNLIRLKTKELWRYHCCCHGNIVTIASMYLADASYPKESSVPNMSPIPLMTKELMRYHCGYHGNLSYHSNRVFG